MTETETTLIDAQIIENNLLKCHIDNMADATIRDIVHLVNLVESDSGEKFIRMEMGIPGLKPSQIGVDAEKKALDAGVASKYPMLEGVDILKQEASLFIKNFINIDLAPTGIVPTVGSMQGGYAAFMTVSACNPDKDTILFIDPGFPVQKQQIDVMGNKYASFDIYDFRGDKLAAKLESYLSQGSISSIVYSNPNNPAWICMTESELQTIGEMATKYDAIVIEDLAYFGMDFRSDLSKPGQGPYQPSVARYTDNYMLLISSSKIFSYAGQRLGLICMSDSLYKRNYQGLKKRFGASEFGYTLIYRIIYTLSSGSTHSSQYALAAIFKAANNGELNILADVQEYGRRAKEMKKIFLSNGFDLVYSTDIDRELADGFYFTVSYKNMTGAQLNKNLLYFGVSAICLDETGSVKQGLRACVSQVSPEQFSNLETRLQLFNKYYS